MAFDCDRCGACCRSLSLHPLGRSLDRGDGTCRYFDPASCLCLVYEQRPFVCRVDEAFHAGILPDVTLSEYYAMTKVACDKLKNIAPFPPALRRRVLR